MAMNFSQIQSGRCVDGFRSRIENEFIKTFVYDLGMAFSSSLSALVVSVFFLHILCKRFAAVFLIHRCQRKSQNACQYDRSAHIVIDVQGLSQYQRSCEYGNQSGRAVKNRALDDLHVSQHICHELRRQQYAEDPQERYPYHEIRMAQRFYQRFRIAGHDYSDRKSVV